MQKFDVQIALEGLAEAKAKWNAGNREFNKGFERVLSRLVHEGARAFMSDREMARLLGWTTHRMRDFMRSHGLTPLSGKRVMADQASQALTDNARLLGINPHDMDLTSPLAYLPMGSDLIAALQEKQVARVTEFPETQGPEPAISLLREVRDCEHVPTYLRAEADQVLDRVYNVQDPE